MQNFRSFSIVLCLQVIYCVCNVACMEFRCVEDVLEIERDNICTLMSYDCLETTQFEIVLPERSRYPWPKLDAHFVHHLRFHESKTIYIPHGIFSKLPSVQSLDMNDCDLSEISRYDFMSATALLNLNLANNHLTTLPDSSFYDANNLIDINLAHNQIAHIHENALKSLSHLININLSYNRIVSIPDDLFGNLLAITNIDLSYNSIDMFGQWFGGLNNLKIDRLNLNYNQMTNISLGPKGAALNVLTIHNNELMGINLDWNTVRILQANNNKVQDVVLSLSECSITELSLKNNSLRSLDFIRNMSNLVHLDLSFNSDAGGTIASDTFTKLTDLKSLRLEAVHLQHLDFQLFSYLLRLEVLDISYTDLTSINFHILSLLDNLKQLYINGNRLTNIILLQEFEFLFPNLELIDITDNNWQCDHLVDILQKLRQINVKTPVDADRMVTKERNIRGIRCYENSSDSSAVTKIPIVREYSSVEVGDTSVAILNQTKTQLNELQQRTESLQFELTELIIELGAVRNSTSLLQEQNENLKLQLIGLINEMKFDMNQTKVKVDNLQNQTIAKLNDPYIVKSDKLMQFEHENGNIDDGEDNNFADDIKFIKIISIVFLVALICALGWKCYGCRIYFDRLKLLLPSRLRTSTNTMTTNVEENNL